MNDHHTKKPRANTSLGKQELDKAEQQFLEFDENVKKLTLDHMNMAPKQDLEPQTKLSQNQLANSKDIYLKPIKSISSKEKFNEDYRANFEFDKEYVYFIAENKEIIGESIDIWTKPYAGMPAEEWMVPVNKPVWGPRYLAEQIKRKNYHRLHMTQATTSQDGMGQYFGTMAAETIVQRIDAMPVSSKRSVFMGSKNF
jgi:hypothetical protein